MVLLHQALPANKTGRDFIMGDLHGCIDLLRAELARVQFNTALDRLFSVGDLIDRGPDSMACLRLLCEPWFYAVRGNHELMLLDYFQNAGQPYAPQDMVKVFLNNGGRWVKRLNAAQRKELQVQLLPRVATLPYVITVGEGASRFNIAHAELLTGSLEQDHWLFRMAGWPEDTASQQILIDDQLTETTLASMTEPIAWGRRLVKKMDPAKARKMTTPAGPLLKSAQAMRAGLSLTYVGHTPQKSMVLHQSHLYIDRGAYKREADTRLLVLNHQDVLDWVA